MRARPAGVESSAGRIVVVDAEPTVRSVVTTILTRAGYVVDTASDIEAALKALEGPLPDLLVTNVYLPGLAGHEAMHLFKQRCPGLKVLMVSGLPDDRVIQRWVGEDGFDVFPKPFTAQALIEKVRQTISKPNPARIRTD